MPRKCVEGCSNLSSLLRNFDYCHVHAVLLQDAGRCHTAACRFALVLMLMYLTFNVLDLSGRAL